MMSKINRLIAIMTVIMACALDSESYIPFILTMAGGLYLALYYFVLDEI